MLGKFFLFCTVAIVAVSSGEVVETRLGKLEGLTRKSRDGRDYTAWTKIPYAKPPIGSLRLANPQPYGTWTGVLNATEPFPLCIQVDGTSFVGQEDCLFLNIYKPKGENGTLPVLFYVHGGGFVLGTPGPSNLADFLMDEKVILVTVTYRLSVLGFMAMNDRVIPGNFGLKDQALALQWVHDNIEDYGGDPKRITVFGESAGGASVHYLLLSPLSKDLVFAAHAISGSVSKVWSIVGPSEVRSASEEIVESVNCTRGTTEEILQCLRAIEDPGVIQRAHAAITSVRDVDFSPLGVTIEPAGPGAVAPEDLSKATSEKPLILSHCNGEFILPKFMDLATGGGRAERIKQDIDGHCRRFLGRFIKDEHKMKRAVKSLRERYFNNETLPALLLGSCMTEQDAALVYPAMRWTKKHKGPKWIYQMAHKGDQTSIGPVTYPEKVAAHSDDMLFMINRRAFNPSLSPRMNPTDEAVSRILIKHLVNLATHGNPTPDGSWKPFKKSEIYQMVTEGFIEGSSSFVKEQHDIDHFWNDLIHAD